MSDKNLLDKVEMLTQPLLTEEGFINEACINELTAAIKNMPKTYKRLANDPEWNTPRWIFKNEIVGAFAKWAIRQSPKEKPIPKGLEGICKYLDACLEKSVDWNQDWDSENIKMTKLSLCEINKLLFDILYEQNITDFDNWNKSAKEEDFIDLHALLHNVCLDIRGERRLDDIFDKKFEEEHGHLRD